MGLVGWDAAIGRLLQYQTWRTFAKWSKVQPKQESIECLPVSTPSTSVGFPLHSPFTAAALHVR